MASGGVEERDHFIVNVDDDFMVYMFTMERLGERDVIWRARLKLLPAYGYAYRLDHMALLHQYRV